MHADLIDPEDFPFTEQELSAAFAQVFDVQGAEKETRILSSGFREVVATRENYRKRIGAGDLGQKFLGYGTLAYDQDSVLALLRLLGPACNTRVDDLLTRLDSVGRTHRERQLMWQIHQTVEGPVPADVSSTLDIEDRKRSAKRGEAFAKIARLAAFRSAER
jgi:hypothetical protein